MMNWSQISRVCLSHLPLKQQCYSFKFFSREHQYLLGWSCYFLTDTPRKCHFSNVSCSPAVAPSSYRHKNNLILRNSACFNQSCSAFFSIGNSLSSIPQGSTEKPHQDRASTSKSVRVPVEGREINEVDTELKKDELVKEETGEAAETAKKLTLYQRFKKTYKEHGKVLVAVHLLTSAVWFGSFYGIARCGFDIVSYMESWNFSERIISPFRSGGLGDVAVAYLMYKLATPARYTVTIGGTNLVIRYLRKEGKIPHIAQEDTIRSLYKEGKEDFKRRKDVHLKRLRRKHKIKQRTVHVKDKH